ncbi:AAA family ATPase [Bradyrhizobium septentrionale]|uniref:AAA family ATPase n=1 Tax=Bradyrhizobium septentrionale TaxID=1404411 RepID=A0A973W2R2_9BRAD|nr:AAA family ATPase [Bradyrhizobium septentrionale]UGY15238.1 AAA family ATPase [Bradyrhizobium septentrionale]
MDDWGKNIEAVADALFGKPTSSKKDELRYGKRGSLRVNTDTGFWDDFESGEGGGTLALIKREMGLEGKDAIEWMRTELKLEIEDRAPEQRSERRDQRDQRERPAPAPAKPKQDGPKPKIVKTYDYVDASGEFLFQVVRMEPKNFLQRRKPRKDDDPNDIKNGWVWKQDVKPQVPYRLPELLEAIADERTIFVVEGEKDVDNLWAMGVPATCNAGGAGKWPEELTQYFRGANVVIPPDNDPQAKNPRTGEPRFHPDGRPVLPGQDHVKLVASKLEGAAESIRILSLPDLPEKGDTSDWIAAGGTSEALYRLVDEKSCTAAEYTAALDLAWLSKNFKSKFGAVVWGEPRTAQQKYEYIIKGLIPRRETVLIYGASQSGKSFFTQDMAMAVSQGGEYLGRKVRRGLVIYCAAEAGSGFVYKRFAGYAAGKGLPDDVYLPFICLTKKFDLFGNDQQVTELIAECKYWVAWWNATYPNDQVELEAVVIDTLNKVTPAMDEINGKEVGLVMSRLDRIREELNTGLWLVHHMNASGTGPRGHTSLYAAFETAIHVGRYDHTEKDAPPRIKDGNNLRDRRFTRMSKQREGEDGEVTDFYLRGVICGYDEDNEIIPGAVVEWIDTPKSREADKTVQESGVQLTDQRANVYRALLRAMEESGIAAPPSLRLPKAITRVVNRSYWFAAYRKYYAEDDSEDAVKKALQRANDFLIRSGVIGRDNPWVWITGKRVRGEARMIAAPEQETAPQAAPVDEGDPVDQNETNWEQFDGDDAPLVEPEMELMEPVPGQETGQSVGEPELEGASE